MNFVTREAAVTSHLFFALTGAAAVSGTNNLGAHVGAGIVGPNYLPDPNDACWIDFDIIEEWEHKIVNEKKVDIHTGFPGFVQRAGQTTTMADLDYTAKLARVTPLSLQLFYRTATLLTADSYQFQPLQIAPPEGWLMGLLFNQFNEDFISFNVYGVARVTGGVKGGKGEIVMPELEVAQFYNVLNTFGLGTPPA